MIEDIYDNFGYSVNISENIIVISTSNAIINGNTILLKCNNLNQKLQKKEKKVFDF